MIEQFEEYLKSKGYKAIYPLNHIGEVYEKDEVRFFLGFSDKGKFKTLLHPRPNLKCGCPVTDNDMKELFERYDFDTIYKSCLDVNYRLLL